MNNQWIFKRYEKKYILNSAQYMGFCQLIRCHMKEDAYGKTTICTLYFDTPDYHLIRRSIEKPVYKEKLRLRTYEVPKGDSMAYVELKKKFEGVVHKRRIQMPYGIALKELTEGAIHYEKSQIANEINYFMKHYKAIQPATALFYNRIAYQGLIDTNQRITIDSNLRWRNETHDLSLGSHGEPLLEDDFYLMEIKINHAMPLWLSALLDQLEIYPKGYSKYGSAYCTAMAQMYAFGE